MRIVNLTPHTVNLITDAGTRVFQSEGVARVSSVSTPVGTATGLPLTRVTFGEVVGLPAREFDVLYVVSALVRSACPNRPDLASPGDLVRDDAGNVVGCRNLIIT
jgi:hypothetical protein